MLKIVDEGWSDELTMALDADSSYLRIICPFMKDSVLKKLLLHQPNRIRVITRFNLSDFALGVSDVAALRRLLKSGAEVRGVQNLHTKLYLFGRSRAIITSANLTEAALNRNHEFGIITDEATTVKKCRAYFKSLWQNAGRNLRIKDVNVWDTRVTRYQMLGGRADNTFELQDFGAKAGISGAHTVHVPIFVKDASNAFVKFQGGDKDRISLSEPTLKELRSGGCHWAVCYPAAKRPTSVGDGDVIFIGRLTKSPNDTRIFGRAIAMAYKKGRDDATPADIERRKWKENYPRYIRVHSAEFLAGTMANGISLNELMDTLREDSFVPTQENAAKGTGNTNPRLSCSRQPAVRLSPEGRMWLEERLQKAFEVHGTISPKTVDKLDWPKLSLIH